MKILTSWGLIPRRSEKCVQQEWRVPSTSTSEFEMIHLPDVIRKYAPEAVICVVGSGKAKKVKGTGKSAPVATDKGDAVANLEAWRDWRMEAFEDTPRAPLVNVRYFVNACYYLVLSIIHEISATIFSAKNFKIWNDPTKLTRSAVFLIFFIVVHTPSEIFTCSRDQTISCTGQHSVSRQTSSKSTCC